MLSLAEIIVVTVEQLAVEKGRQLTHDEWAGAALMVVCWNIQRFNMGLPTWSK